MKKSYTVSEDFINTRLDRWLKKNVGKIPQSLIQKNLRKGKIKVNNKKVKSSYKLKITDTIDLYDFKYTLPINQKRDSLYKPTKKDISFSSNLFIEDNNNFVVINKPAGISVQSGTKSKRNIIDILRKTKEFINFTPFPVHRIDKDTTGILIVAKNRKFAQLFTSLFRLRKIHKTYLGLVLGELTKKKGTLDDILFYYEGKNKIESKAITHFTTIESNSRYSLLKLIPETGRKHQIRKQLLIAGNPIFGDVKYRLSRDFSKKDTRLMLHAHKIAFSINNIKYNFTAELPLDFKKNLREKSLRSF